MLLEMKMHGARLMFARRALRGLALNQRPLGYEANFGTPPPHRRDISPSNLFI